jgi:small-conductance mechanosensitive channel
MPFNIFNWLFQDAITAGGPNPDGSEVFHYFWPYLIFCGVGLLIWFYYWVEGRKRFVKSKPILKYMLDRYLNWLAIICFIGIPIDLARFVLPGYFFAWRFWRYLWLVALLVWAVLWIVYLVRKYPSEKANYIAYREREQYIRKPKRKESKSKRKVRTASR